MPRLIDATRIEQYILNYCSDNEEINAIYAEIINAPTVDAEPVKHGHWIDESHTKNERVFKCSVCGNYLDFDGVNVGRGDANYCPNCGAKMQGEERR